MFVSTSSRPLTKTRDLKRASFPSEAATQTLPMNWRNGRPGALRTSYYDRATQKNLLLDITS